MKAVDPIRINGSWDRAFCPLAGLGTPASPRKPQAARPHPLAAYAPLLRRRIIHYTILCAYVSALPFSLSMGCGTWGRNSISDNLNYRHFLNITRVVRPLTIPRREPGDDELFGAYRKKHGV